MNVFSHIKILHHQERLLTSMLTQKKNQIRMIVVVAKVSSATLGNPLGNAWEITRRMMRYVKP